MQVDGLEIRWQGWLGESEPRAVFFVVHGLAEHSERYGELVAHFNHLGVACYALDLRGHGRSAGRRVHVASFADYDRDVESVLAEVAERHPHLPIFFVGHSMGGLLVLRRLLDRALSRETRPGLSGSGPALPEVAGAVVSSPGLAAHPSVHPPWWLRLAAHLLAPVVPRLLVPTGLSPRWISHDADVVEAYENDPLVSKRTSIRWYRSFVAAQRRAMERAPHLDRPVLLLQAGDDRLVDPSATERFARRAPSCRVTYRRWPGLFHEIFHEAEKREVFLSIEAWLEDRLDRLEHGEDDEDETLDETLPGTTGFD